MKLILSRKGFDSSAGGVPSPILPDGRMVSLPIPDRDAPISYADIEVPGVSMGDVVAHLTKGRIPPHYRAHLDPDLIAGSRPRSDGWRPLFGQTGAAQGHLRKHGVGPGDLFLFFGLFRGVDQAGGQVAYAKKSRPCHVIWGWLQVGEALALGNGSPDGYGWAATHPHFYGDRGANNTLYVARKDLALDGVAPQRISGGGIFSHFSPGLRLTAASASSPGAWDLPGWFYPTGGRIPLTYHANLDRWLMNGTRTELKSAARGQEFILDCDAYPEAIPWIVELFSTGR